MKLRTVVRDCLFLNWALPAAALPELPGPLRYQLHEWQGADHVFASALLFHHDAVAWAALPLLRVGYPQLNVRLYVIDADGVPSVFFLRELMPAWVAPGVRLVSHHPASSARLDFPRPSRQAGDGTWLWRAQRGGTLTVRAWVHSPSVGVGPRIGGWQETVQYFQDRPRGYALHGGVLHRVTASHPPADAVWPLAAEVAGGGELIRSLLPSSNGAHGLTWPALHSSWLCPEMPFSIVVDLAPKVVPVVSNGLPHPATGRVSSPALLAAPPRPPAGPQCPPELAPPLTASAAPATPATIAEPAGAAGRLGRMAGAAVLASAA